jgi:AcrR family transcriptional regulator
MSAEPGLRERKKRRMREQIADTARRLFAERGFDAVTVAEVARAADVSEGTVFNYFPTKEDLFYAGMQAFWSELVEVVRRRPAGQSVLQAFGAFALSGSERLASEDHAAMVATAARIISASSALQARARAIDARATGALAALIAEETGDSDGIEPWVVANALMGVHAALVSLVHRSVLAGERGPELATKIRTEGRRAFARLEQGLDTYAVKPG